MTATALPPLRRRGDRLPRRAAPFRCISGALPLRRAGEHAVGRLPCAAYEPRTAVQPGDVITVDRSARVASSRTRAAPARLLRAVRRRRRRAVLADAAELAASDSPHDFDATVRT